MNRYQIAKINNKTVSVYVFQPSRNVAVIYDYLKMCIRDNVSFDSKGMREGLLDVALIKLSREVNRPVVVWSEQKMKIMSIVNSYNNIFTLSSLPDKYHQVIDYKSHVPSNYEIFLRIT